jgi:hypothetical protein
MKLHAVAAAAAAALAAAAFLMPLPDSPTLLGRPGVTGPIETVQVAPGRFEYQVAGEFLKSGRVVEGPKVDKQVRRPLEIMKYQVSVAEYAACVEDGACQPADTRMPKLDMPVTGVSWRDATAYAAWLSQRTGDDWRLPDDEEWAFAAAERFGPEANGLIAEDDGSNPAVRWLAAYRSRGAPVARDMAPTLPAMSGNGPEPASCATASTPPAGWPRRRPIAACASSVASTAATCRTSCATARAAAVPPAWPRPTISASGWSGTPRPPSASR